jgi:hypothetical protein
MIKKIKTLEAESKKLEPTSKERKEYSEKIFNYSQNFLENLSSLKAYQSTKDNGAGIYDSPVSDKPLSIEKILDLINQHIDKPGINPASQRFMGYIPGGGIFPSALGDYLADITSSLLL